MTKAVRFAPIWETAKTDAWVESGDPHIVQSSSRVAFVASWGPGPDVGRSLVCLVNELERAGYACIVIRASDSSEPLRWPSDAGISPIVVRRSNIGYDFGSWAVGMELFTSALDAPYVLVVNDSMVGPFASLASLIGSFENCYTNAWGMTSTMQYMPHLQSFFLGFRNGLLADPNIRAFWRSVRHEERKIDVILNYELGLSRVLFGEAYSFAAEFPVEIVSRHDENPAVSGWSRLIELGVPMIKRELVRHPELVGDGSLIGETIRRRFGADVQDWL